MSLVQAQGLTPEQAAQVQALVEKFEALVAEATAQQSLTSGFFHYVLVVFTGMMVGQQGNVHGLPPAMFADLLQTYGNLFHAQALRAYQRRPPPS